jgi:hypothetical protein
MIRQVVPRIIAATFHFPKANNPSIDFSSERLDDCGIGNFLSVIPSPTVLFPAFPVPSQGVNAPL